MSLDITVHTHEDTPQTYRKKPVEVQAIKWTGKNFDAVKEFAGDDVDLDGDELVIKTLEDGSKGQAKHVATVGDFVIRGVAGNFISASPRFLTTPMNLWIMLDTPILNLYIYE